METLIHSPDGKLETDNPWRKVGTRGTIKYTNNKFIIVEESLKDQDTYANGRYQGSQHVGVAVLDPVDPSLDNLKLPMNGSIYGRDMLEIIEPSNPNYFKVKGFDF